jgi:hypothetical protein
MNETPLIRRTIKRRYEVQKFGLLLFAQSALGTGRNAKFALQCFRGEID